MSELGWFDGNRNRAFPFLKRSTGVAFSGPLTLLNLPPEVVVDAGFVVGPQSRFQAAEHEVRLVRIRRQSNVFYFEFACTAPALFNVLLTFTRAFVAEQYTYELLDSGDDGLSASLSDSALGACHEPLWWGYLVTGDMAALDAFLSADGEVVGSTEAAVIEPALIQNLAGSYVISLSVANDDRTRAAVPDGCPEPVWPFQIGGVMVHSRCLREVVYLQSGYNISIKQNSRDNSITFSAVEGAGAGQPCEQVPLFPAETPPADSQLLEGGLYCNEVLRSINGIAGPLFQVTAGQGTNVATLPELNTVIISLDMSGLALCFSAISDSC